MSKHVRHATHRLGLTKLAAVVGVGGLGLSLSLAGAYSALNATANNATAQAIGSGTLKLVLADNGAGFTQVISNLAPADVVNRFVDLTNSGTLDGRILTLAPVDATPTKLTTDATNGLHVTIIQCTGATWTAATATCGAGGTTTTLVNNSALKTVIATPVTVVSGAVTAGTALHLQISLTLPDQVETTVNGVLPSNSIQALTASLTWTFSEVQRAGITTSS